MKVTVLLAIVLIIAFATAGFVERQARVTATGTTNLTSTTTSPTEGVGTGALLGSPHANAFSVHTFDPLAQTLGTSSTALLEIELQRLMRTW
jgi:hypothetical protein